MSLRVEELPRAKRVWNDFIRKNGGGILQSYEWGEFRAELEWQVSHLAVKDGPTIRLAGLVMRRRIPGGYHFLYCPEGPIVKDGDWHDPKNQQAFTVFADHLAERARGERIVFAKIDPHLPAADFPVEWLAAEGFRDSPEDIQSGIVTEVDLTPPAEQIFQAMKQKGRYHIRQAVKKGVKAFMGKSPAELDAFYELLDQTAERQGITRREKWYYELLRKHLMQRADHARFFIAKHDGVPVAAILVTFFGREAVYLYGGTAPQDRNLYASYLVQWAGMEEAKRRGCSFYNMTGVAETDDPEEAWAGLRQFKLKFGGPVIRLVGARDYAFQPLLYHGFTQADRLRRKFARMSGR